MREVTAVKGWDWVGVGRLSLEPSFLRLWKPERQGRGLLRAWDDSWPSTVGQHLCPSTGLRRRGVEGVAGAGV